MLGIEYAGLEMLVFSIQDWVLWICFKILHKDFKNFMQSNVGWFLNSVNFGSYLVISIIFFDELEKEHWL